ncbi:hypothetical protein HNR26_003860 [Rhizobium rosettiformans]|uniref:Uncharacterized protein n=2 Tax=Rhizobium rosettiformans TaxID=1368430 RepID=A0A4S8PYR9_9HYPH|nr:hypothetical protein [Rhizobium rosettiformans]MBB5277771.1 hypothetical protein [Rhizobium rosettiformans]THV32934.1 hypothetical protein FAA86_18765 [Rhizobium rosettiformans W3]
MSINITRNRFAFDKALEVRPAGLTNDEYRVAVDKVIPLAQLDPYWEKGTSGTNGFPQGFAAVVIIEPLTKYWRDNPYYQNPFEYSYFNVELKTRGSGLSIVSTELLREGLNALGITRGNILRGIEELKYSGDKLEDLALTIRVSLNSSYDEEGVEHLIKHSSYFAPLGR